MCIRDSDYGAEGHEIGKMLSMELGIPLYDNELLVRSAARSGEADVYKRQGCGWRT